MYIAQETKADRDQYGNPRKLVTLYDLQGCVLGFIRYSYWTREQALEELLRELGLDSGPVTWIGAYRPIGRDKVGWVNCPGTVQIKTYKGS